MEQVIKNCLVSGDDVYNIKSLVPHFGDNLLNDSEVTLLLACYFYNKNLKLLGFDESCSLEELNLDLGFEEYFTMSIIDNDSQSPRKNTQNVGTACYDNLYSKEYISKARFCQKLLNKVVDNMFKLKIGNESFEDQDPEFDEFGNEEGPVIIHPRFGNKSLDHIIERSDEESHDFESNDSLHYHHQQRGYDSDESLEETHEIEGNTHSTSYVIQDQKQLKSQVHENSSDESKVGLKLNKNAPSFKPKTIKKMSSQSSNTSNGSSKNIEMTTGSSKFPVLMSYAQYGQASPVPSPPPFQSASPHLDYSQYQNYGQSGYQQVQQAVQPNYMISQAIGIPKIESGMLISYHSSSMMGVIQSIPSGEQILVEIGELSSIGIGIDFLYNLARIRLMCSFQKKYVYDQNYQLRATATNLKVISIDVVQS